MFFVRLRIAQAPVPGIDPEFDGDHQVLVKLAWLALPRFQPETGPTSGPPASQLAAFLAEIESWGDRTCYPTPQETP